MRGTPEERFDAKVVRGHLCWEWLGAISSKGYGNFWSSGKTGQAHRFAWESRYGQVPEGVCVLHRCDNPKCVNPEHLFLGTQRDNVADRCTKGRSSGGSMPGEHNPRSKITERQARDIIDLRNKGHALKEIAEKFDMADSVVSRIARGKRWGHLQPVT